MASTVILAAVLLVACGKKEAPPGSPVAVTSGKAPASPIAVTWRVGVDVAYPPFERFGANGRIGGFDVDLLNAIATRGGFNLEFLNSPWRVMFDMLIQGERDLLASAIAITPERAQRMDFSEPYFVSRQVIVAREGVRAARLSDLPVLRVAVQAGSYGDEAVSKLLGPGNRKVKRSESAWQALLELDKGDADAVVTASGVALHYRLNNPQSRIKVSVVDELPPVRFGIAVKKGNAELLRQINKALAEMAVDGSYDDIYVRYFGRPVEPLLVGREGTAASSSRRDSLKTNRSLQ